MWTGSSEMLLSCKASSDRKSWADRVLQTESTRGNLSLKKKRKNIYRLWIFEHRCSIYWKTNYKEVWMLCPFIDWSNSVKIVFYWIWLSSLVDKWFWSVIFMPVSVSCGVVSTRCSVHAPVFAKPVAEAFWSHSFRTKGQEKVQCLNHAGETWEMRLFSGALNNHHIVTDAQCWMHQRQRAFGRNGWKIWRELHRRAAWNMQQMNDFI